MHLLQPFKCDLILRTVLQQLTIFQVTTFVARRRRMHAVARFLGDRLAELLVRFWISIFETSCDYLKIEKNVYCLRETQDKRTLLAFKKLWSSCVALYDRARPHQDSFIAVEMHIWHCRPIELHDLQQLILYSYLFDCVVEYTLRAREFRLLCITFVFCSARSIARRVKDHSLPCSDERCIAYAAIIIVV